MQDKPKLADLMNKVAVKIPNKWYTVGIQLELEHGELASIASSGPIDPQFKFASVFTEWNKHSTPEYSWATIINVLKTPAINEQRLAEELFRKLSGQPYEFP